MKNLRLLMDYDSDWRRHRIGREVPLYISDNLSKKFPFRPY